MQNELRSKAKELLASGEVKRVIGYAAGSMPFKCTPDFAETPEEADQLVWNPTCVNNLSVYLPQGASKEKVAVVLKPCDVKNVVELIKENQVDRENVVLIAMSCPGVLNIEALKDIDPREIQSVEWKDGEVTVRTSSGETTIPRDQAFLSKCLTCDLGEPVLSDVKIGKFGDRAAAGDKFASVEEYEKLSPAERRAFWAKQFEQCIRCYGCRQACPTCYCKECFVDKQAQMWASKATDPTSNWFFHMTRMMHLAGRCTGCGECERACPMNIPLSLISKRMALDVMEMFADQAGVDAETAPVLGCFTMHDPDPCPE